MQVWRMLAVEQQSQCLIEVQRKASAGFQAYRSTCLEVGVTVAGVDSVEQARLEFHAPLVIEATIGGTPECDKAREAYNANMETSKTAGAALSGSAAVNFANELQKVADQEFKKHVAIKVIRKGMASAEIVSRFRRERQILAALLADESLEVVRQACIEVFDARAQQSWPPTVTVHDHWPRIYTEALSSVEDLGLAADVQDAAMFVNDFIHRVDVAGQ